MKIELCCCTNTLLDEIKHTEMTKKIIAMTYRLALESSEKVDWSVVNRAIIKRWSISALRDIKKMAWSGKCFFDKRRK